MPKVEKKPCVSCGHKVPERQEFPFKGHKKDCDLVREWRLQIAWKRFNNAVIQKWLVQ